MIEKHCELSLGQIMGFYRISQDHLKGDFFDDFWIFIDRWLTRVGYFHRFTGKKVVGKVSGVSGRWGLV